MRSFLALVGVLALVAAASAALTNSAVNREIDLTTNLEVVTTTVELSNSGGSAVSTFDVVIGDHVAHFAVSQGDAQLATAPSKASGAPKGSSLYTVTLADSIGADDVTEVVIETTAAGQMTPFPKEIKQNERQLVLYNSNVYFSSPYPSDAQTTTVVLASALVESFSEEEPTSLAGDVITYGEYSDVGAFASAELKVHFENNSPFVMAPSMVKDIEVSMWGNVAVEESYEFLHAGAALKGGFSRYEYQRNPVANGMASVKSLTSYLPSGAADVYYRDVIGNISTSNFHVNDDGDHVFEMRPRFPLFGAWRTSFYLGYNLPAFQYLFSGPDYKLAIPFGSGFENVAVASATINVILPEGSSDISVTCPFEIDGDASFGKHYTYLDSSGRNVVTVTKTNMVPAHNDANCEVHFAFSTITMFREPAMLVLFFFALFAAFMAYLRVDLGISGSAEDEATLVLHMKLVANAAARYSAEDKLEAAAEAGGSSKAATEALNTLFKELGALAEGAADPRVADFVENEKARRVTLQNLIEMRRKAAGDKGGKYDGQVDRLSDELAAIQDQSDHFVQEFGG